MRGSDSSASSPDPISWLPLSSPSKRAASQRATLSPTKSGGNQLRYNTPHATSPSPTKSIVMSTARTNGASPWRIKVTVEAEPQVDENSAFKDESPLPPSRTVTVPLKSGDDSSLDTKSTGGRKKRRGTPVRRTRAKTPIGDTDGDVDEDETYKPSMTKRRVGRPRKSVGDSVLDSLIPDDETQSVVDKARVEKSSSSSALEPALQGDPRNYRTQKATAARPPRQTFDFTKLTPLHTKHELPELNVQTPSPTKRLRERKPTPVKRTAWYSLVHGLDEESACKENDGSDIVRIAKNKPPTPIKHSLANRSAFLKVTDIASSSRKSSMSRRNDRALHEDGQQPSEYRHSDTTLDTVASSEDDDLQDDSAIGEQTFLQSQDFSMVSVESLQSIRGEMSVLHNHHEATIAPSESQRRTSNNAIEGNSTGDEIPPQLTPESSILLESDIRDSAPSDDHPPEPIQDASRITPAVVPLSPRQPPTVEVPRSNPQKLSTPEMTQIQKIASVLQDVVHPPATSNSSRSTSKQPRLGTPIHVTSSIHSPTPKKRDDLFSAAPPNLQSSITYPRLLTPEDQASCPNAVHDALAEDVQVAFPSLSVQMARTQLISPDRSDEELMRQTIVTSSVSQARPSYSRPRATPQSKGKAPDYDSTPLRKVVEEREIEWQKARDAVILQVEQANSNQVVVLDDVMDEDDALDQEDEDMDVRVSEMSRDIRQPMTSPAPAERSYHARSLQAEDLSFIRRSRQAPAQPPASSPRVHFANNESSSPGVEKPTLTRTSSDDSDFTTITESSEESVEVIEGAVDEPLSVAEDTEEDTDTGNFFIHNLPAVFGRSDRRSIEVNSTRPPPYASTSPHGNEHSAQKLDLSLLISPEKQRPVQMKRRSKSPPRPADVQKRLKSMPTNSSPLRRQLSPPGSSPPRFESTRFDHSVEDAALEINPDDEAEASFNNTTMSDVRQLRNEIAAQSSAKAEITPQRASRDSHTTKVAVNFGSIFTEHETKLRDESCHLSIIHDDSGRSSLLLPTKSYRPLFDTAAERTLHYTTTARIGHSTSTAAAQTSAPDLLSRLGSSLFTALIGNPFGISARPPPQPITHPTLKGLPLLPKQEPWTLTHYKVLTLLYQRLLKNPASFDPDSPESGIMDSGVLDTEQGTLASKYQDLCVRNWGYEVHLSHLHTTLIALYCQLLVLNHMDEYEPKNGRKIELGEPYADSMRRIKEARQRGKTVDMKISPWEVLGRLFSVVAGDLLREDERQGKEINRNTQGRMRWKGSDEWVPCAF